MGGVDNWIMASFDQGAPIDYTQNYAYQTLATNMRGFQQNIRNGNNFVVLNSELRFPVFSYFMNRPINMKFIKDFQIVAFGDLGTAWTGWNPYDPSNSLYNTHINDGNLNITVTEMKEPIVGGIGFGLRTTLFGYFIRGYGMGNSRWANLEETALLSVVQSGFLSVSLAHGMTHSEECRGTTYHQNRREN